MPEAIENAPASKIAVDVSKGRSGLHALKWALEKEVPANGLVYLMHVQPPIRWVPNAMGGNFPVEQVRPEVVKQFKKERFLEAEKLVEQYRRMCNKKKIKSEVCYSESDSVKKELVHQISKLGITKLVLGTSSENVLSRALRKESVSTYVAKHAPGFCEVLVVNKENLCHVKKATEAPALQCSSPSSTSEASVSLVSETVSLVSETDMGSYEDDSRTSDDIRNGEISMSSGATDDISTSLSQEASLDFSQSCFEWPLSKLDCSIEQLNDRHDSEASLFDEPLSIEDRFFDSIGIVHAFSSVTANRNIYRAMETSERSQYPACDTVSQITMDIGAPSIIETQRSLHAHENGLLGPDKSRANCSAMVVPEVDLLQRQLNEAKLRADRAQREAEWQTNNLKKAQEVAASAMKMVMEHEKRRVEALREAQKAKQQATKDAKRCEEALAALQWAQRDHELTQQRLAEEVERHQKTQMELETQKRMVDAYAIEAALAKQQVQAERSRCEEMTAKLEDLTRKLEMECQLRKEAEEKASLEAVAKVDALAALRRECERYSEYTYEELHSATNGFNEGNKLGEGGYGPVYRGKLRHTSVAIKVLARERSRGREEFQREVELLSHIRHPHMLMLLGACPENGCIVYEYMANGSLEDRLNCKDGTPPLPWYARFRICFEVATALLFLHSQPQPIAHRDLKPANILLDHHFVSKIGDIGLARLVPYNITFSVTQYKDSVPVGTFAYIDPDYQRTGVVSCESDVYSLGIVMLQLLTGKPAVGVAHLVEEAEKKGKLEEVLDKSAGEWSLEEARKLARISLQCTEFKRRDRPKLERDILPVLESIRNVAELAAANMATAAPPSSGMKPMVPSFFFCPILQEIMEDPHMAADGFTYEHHAIKVWLQANNTSPMTNLRLDHKNLTPNHTMRSAIREWYANGLIQN